MLFSNSDIAIQQRLNSTQSIRESVIFLINNKFANRDKVKKSEFNELIKLSSLISNDESIILVLKIM